MPTVIGIVVVFVFVPSVTVRVTVKVPAVSYTCAATGPVAELRQLTLRSGGQLAPGLAPGLLPAFQVVPLTGDPAGSPKSQRYSISWNGRAVKGLVVAVASKNTASGATPEERDGIAASDIVGVGGNTVTVTVALALPPELVQVRE